MNRRITKIMAIDAAARMKREVFGKKIEKAQYNLYSVIEQLVRKYLPKPVILCVNEYSLYFNCCTCADVTQVVQDGNGTYRKRYIRGFLSFKVPSNTLVTVDAEEYKAVEGLYRNLKDLEKKRDDFGSEIQSALLSLKTEKAINESLPEAIKYIDFPDIKSLPSPIYSNLRAMLIGIDSK